jgi:hypothetical protein
MIRDYKKLNKTGRKKKKYVNPCYNIDDIYKFYNKEYGNREGFYLTAKEFKNICSDYNKAIAALIVEESQSLTIPHRLGEMFVKKKKMDYEHLKLDFNHYKKTGVKRYHTNIHSKGWIAKWHWSKKNCVIKNKRYYSFTPCDTLKKQIASIMKTPDGYKRYFE